MLRAIQNLTKGLVALASITLPIIIFTAPVSADSLNYRVNVESSLGIEVESEPSIDLNPLVKPYGTSDLTIAIGTNYTNGYKVYANSSSTDLINSDYPENYYINTLTAVASDDEATFPANYWGYRITSYDGEGGDSSITDLTGTYFYPFASNTLIASNSEATKGDQTTLTFASKVNYENPAGVYTNTITLSTLINPVTYSITYADNTGDTISDLPSPNPDIGMVSDGALNISSTIPTRTGYIFSAWCLGTVSDSGMVCTGTTYQAGDAIDLSTEAGPLYSVTLYATWTMYIQDFTASMCQAVASSTAVTVIDSRDSQAYTVRYINGGCWMTRNLAIGCNGSGSTYGSSVSSKRLTSASSNVSSAWSTPTALLTGGSTDMTTARMQCSSTYGAWYNYTAASAGTTTGSSNNKATYYSICPSGWRLPTLGEFDGILDYVSEFSPAAGGYYRNGKLNGAGGAGYYYSTTVRDVTYRRCLLYNASTGIMNTSTYGNTRYDGPSVRCIRSS